jgi:hypothetical protein
MFARVITVEADIGKMEEGIKRTEEEITTVIKNQEGFLKNYIFLNRESGQVISAALYESEELAKAVEESGVLKEALSNLAQYMTGTPKIEGYEVVIDV